MKKHLFTDKNEPKYLKKLIFFKLNKLGAEKEMLLPKDPAQFATSIIIEIHSK